MQRAFLLLICFVAATAAQEPPKAVLYDEFGKPDCELLWARLDGLASELQKRPDTVAIVDIISAPSKDPHIAFYWDSMIRGYFIRRKFPQHRLNIRRGVLASDWSIKFWVSSPGARLPELKESKWQMIYQSGSKPFLFTNGESYSVEVGVCLDVDEIALLAKALGFNPGARVNVVLIARSNREFLRRKAKVTETLVNGYSIDRSRFRIIKKINSKPNPYGIDPTTEYWLLP